MTHGDVMKTLATAFAILVVLTTAAAPLHGQSGYDLFQKALATERADGDLRGAIQLYERIVKEFGSDRSLASRALLRIAECYEKLGQAGARPIYERVLREYADQEAATTARARLRVDEPARSLF